MRKNILFLLILIFEIATLSAVIAQDEFELVESTPVETSLEESGLPRTLNVWLKMINESKSTIDIETFYFANKTGEPLEQVLNALKVAAVRGVQIRIIVDSNFYSNNDKSVDELEGIQNIQIRKIPIGNIAGGVMHAKYFIVDGENLFMGSQNMDWRALIHIHEIGARIKNRDLARTFGELFETDWKLCEGNYYGLTNRAVNFFCNSANPVTITSTGYGKVILFPAFSPAKINMTGLNTEEEELLKVIGDTRKD